MKIILLMTQSLDGKVAKSSDEFVDWSSKEDKKLFVTETKRAGVVIMGRKTFDTIGKPLPGRRIIVMTRAPRPEIRNETGFVRFTSAEPKQIIADLETEGKEEAILAGGPTINSVFLKQGLIDEIKLTIEPRIFGRGLSVFEGIDANTGLELIESRNLTPNVIFLHYKIRDL